MLQLHKDIVKQRKELDETEIIAIETQTQRDHADSDHYRAEAKIKNLRQKVGELKSAVDKQMLEAAKASVEFEQTVQKKKAREEGVRILRKRIACICEEKHLLGAQLQAAKDETRTSRKDLQALRKQSEKAKDHILKVKDPDAFQRTKIKRRAERRESNMEARSRTIDWLAGSFSFKTNNNICDRGFLQRPCIPSSGGERDDSTIVSGLTFDSQLKADETRHNFRVGFLFRR